MVLIKNDLIVAELNLQSIFFQKVMWRKMGIRLWLHNYFILITNKNRVVMVRKLSVALMQRKTTLLWVTVCLTHFSLCVRFLNEQCVVTPRKGLMVMTDLSWAKNMQLAEGCQDPPETVRAAARIYYQHCEYWWDDSDNKDSGVTHIRHLHKTHSQKCLFNDDTETVIRSQEKDLR